jgi:hypothetical protein
VIVLNQFSFGHPTRDHRPRPMAWSRGGGRHRTRGRPRRPDPL